MSIADTLGPALVEEVKMEALDKWSQDLKKSAALMPREQARWLVDIYYQMQHFRIATNNQIRGIERGGFEPHEVIRLTFDNTKQIENNIKNCLGRFAARYAIGNWMQSIVGIGPVISAGLLAHFDIRKAPYPGHFISFAGMNPDAVWEKGCKRPWNADLKTLCCFKLGECFVKVQNHKDDFYGKIFKGHKDELVEQNLQGKFQDVATQILKDKKFNKSTDAYKWYSGRYKPMEIVEYQNKLAAAERLREEEVVDVQSSEVGKPELYDEGEGVPMLPPAHLHARARRSAVKMFVYHLHEMMAADYRPEETYPDPYIMAHGTNHSHKIDPPNQDKAKGESLKVLLEDETTPEE